MTLLIKMTLVTFSLSLMPTVRALFIFLGKWINSNLNEWYPPRKEYEKKRKIQRVGFWKFSFSIHDRILSVYTIELIFRNILPSKPSLNLFFLIVWLWSSCCYSFVYIIFFSWLFMSSAYSTCSKLLLFIFTNLIQIEEKTRVQVTVRFADYAFNENINIYCFHEWNVFLIHLFNDLRKN